VSGANVSAWTPQTWRDRPIEQQPTYADREAVEAALDVVRALPPLVSAGEVLRLRGHLAKVAAGEAYLLQGGDCAERFMDCSLEAIESKLKILLQMSLVLTWGARMPIVRVGRLAGQYAKPRSSPMEVIDGVSMFSYRGDHVNRIAPTPEAREPDPSRLVAAYFRSAATLNYVRSLIEGGFADLHNPRDWDLGFVRSVAARSEYEEMVERILDAVSFMRTVGASFGEALRRVEMYTSHEGLLLEYEEAQTCKVGDEWLNLGAHMLWIGDRTRQLDGAHVEYFRGLSNPIGVKVGPSMETEELIALIQRLDPKGVPGKITLITRLGAEGVQERLPGLVRAVSVARLPVVWSCDPMHGNTYKAEGGLKTRKVDQILKELRHTFDVHEECGSRLGGVHFEMTGEDVTECIGGPQELSEADLSRSYETYCDPRLNYAQSLEMAFLIAQRLHKGSP
jgi:3-deoxy-7-phosphoheptulonate synthase